MKWSFYLVSVVALLCGCASSHPALSQAPRTITLDGSLYSEEASGELDSWLCSDFLDDWGRVLVEVGTFSNPDLGGVGFVIYDGGDSGNLTSYERRGINLRWDWGPNGNDFAFVIKPDGTGLFYDFTNANGEPKKANEVFECRHP